MEYKYTVVDVETPNIKNNRICSIGIALIEDGQIVSSENILVNPECNFSRINTSIHHITAGDVALAPKFPSVWERIEPLFFGRIVVGHNVRFDLTVISKALSAYGIRTLPITYLDTFELAQKIYPSAPSWKLFDLCEQLGLPTGAAHDSGDDCLATAGLLRSMLERVDDIFPLLRVCEMDAAPPKKPEKGHFYTPQYSTATESLSDLKSLLSRIICDDRIDCGEFEALVSWVDGHSELSGHYPYEEVRRSIAEIRADGEVTVAELESLKDLCYAFVDPVEALRCASAVDLNDKTVVLTGDFARGSKDDVSAELQCLGAVIKNGVTKKTDVILVGSLGNPAWSGGNYGSKIKKALELIESGCAIAILKEADYFGE